MTNKADNHHMIEAVMRFLPSKLSDSILVNNKLKKERAAQSLKSQHLHPTEYLVTHAFPSVHLGECMVAAKLPRTWTALSGASVGL